MEWKRIKIEMKWIMNKWSYRRSFHQLSFISLWEWEMNWVVDWKEAQRPKRMNEWTNKWNEFVNGFISRGGRKGLWVCCLVGLFFWWVMGCPAANGSAERRQTPTNKQQMKQSLKPATMQNEQINWLEWFVFAELKNLWINEAKQRADQLSLWMEPGALRQRSSVMEWK